MSLISKLKLSVGESIDDELSVFGENSHGAACLKTAAQ